MKRTILSDRRSWPSPCRADRLRGRQRPPGAGSTSPSAPGRRAAAAARASHRRRLGANFSGVDAARPRSTPGRSRPRASRSPPSSTSAAARSTSGPRGRRGRRLPGVHRLPLAFNYDKNATGDRPRRGLHRAQGGPAADASRCSTSRRPRTRTPSSSPRRPPARSTLKTIADLKAVAGDFTRGPPGVQDAAAGHPGPEEGLRHHVQGVPPAHRPGDRRRR